MDSRLYFTSSKFPLISANLALERASRDPFKATLLRQKLILMSPSSLVVWISVCHFSPWNGLTMHFHNCITYPGNNPIERFPFTDLFGSVGPLVCFFGLVLWLVQGRQIWGCCAGTFLIFFVSVNFVQCQEALNSLWSVRERWCLLTPLVSLLSLQSFCAILATLRASSIDPMAKRDSAYQVVIADSNWDTAGSLFFVCQVNIITWTCTCHKAFKVSAAKAYSPVFMWDWLLLRSSIILAKPCI